jgi:hypothetical protein
MLHPAPITELVLTWPGPPVEPFCRLALSRSPIYKAQVPHPLEVYFSRLRDIRGAGIGQRETSYYDALATLLTAYGRKLNPRVTCVMQIRNQGAGIPDGGLFTAEQLRARLDRAEQVPSRGVIEAKAFDADVERVSQTEQVRNYLGRYGLVLVTNFREFLLLDRDRNGNPRRVDAPYRFAASEESFAEAIGQPRTLRLYQPHFNALFIRGSTGWKSCGQLYSSLSVL